MDRSMERGMTDADLVYQRVFNQSLIDEKEPAFVTQSKLSAGAAYLSIASVTKKPKPRPWWQKVLPQGAGQVGARKDMMHGRGRHPHRSGISHATSPTGPLHSHR